MTGRRARGPAFFIAFCAATLGATSTSARDPGRDASAFVARARAEFEAARPASEIVESTIATSGLTGTEHDERRGDDRALTTVLGPFTTRRGSVGGETWHQTENGATVLEGREPSASPSPDPGVPRTLARVDRPRDLWLVTSSLANGATKKTFYDPRDLAIVREETSLGKHFVRIEYSDFRPWNGGKRRAWVERRSDDRGDAYVRTIVSDRVGIAIDDADFAIPADRAPLVEFPTGVNQTTLPATVENARIHVTVEIDGTPLTFVLDSGASGIVLDAQAAKDLKLPSYGTRSLTVAGTFASSRVVAHVLRVGSLVMRDVALSTAPFDEREGSKRVVGLLGFDFLAGVVLRVDYIDPGSVVAIRPSIFTRPPLATSAMPIDLGEQVPVVHVGVGDASSDHMVVDTGAQAPVLFFDRFVKAHPAAVVDRGFAAPFDPAQDVISAIGGGVRIVPLRIASFRFADLDFRNYLVLRAENAGAFNDRRDDGLLGALFLRFYTLYVDYPHRELYFEPNENYARGVGKPLEP